MLGGADLGWGMGNKKGPFQMRGTGLLEKSKLSDERGRTNRLRHHESCRHLRHYCGYRHLHHRLRRGSLRHRCSFRHHHGSFRHRHGSFRRLRNLLRRSCGSGRSNYGSAPSRSAMELNRSERAPNSCGSGQNKISTAGRWTFAMRSLRYCMTEMSAEAAYRSDCSLTMALDCYWRRALPAVLGNHSLDC